jgi:hypothetical protein
VSEPKKALSDDLPAPHPSYVLHRVFVEALLAELPAKRSARILETMAMKLADEENLSQVFPIRPSSEQEKVRQAQVHAVAMFRMYLPLFLARISRR